MGKTLPQRIGGKSLLFLALLVLILLGTIWPSIKKAQTAGKRTSGLSHCKALAGALFTFKTEFGDYPCPRTRDLLISEGARNLRIGTDANSYLAQLIVSGTIDSERYFYCELGKGYHQGDGKIEAPTDLLAPGENSYAYVMNKEEAPLRQTKNHTPIIMAPIVSGDSVPTFDPTPFDHYYIYGAVDGSAKIGKISQTGLPLSKGHPHLFSTEENSLFENQSPDVKIPIRKY